MKYYEIWQNKDGLWLIYEVTGDGQHFRLIKTRKTKPTAWAAKQWYRVIWR